MQEDSEKYKNTVKEVDQHNEMWTQDNDKRINRKGGWNDVTDAYYGKLPDDWPYITKIVDPRIRTSLIEKNARLINNKLRGRLVPREGSDILGAKINNSLLDFQWENANDGGSMLTKMSICDMDARLYQSKFALVKWKCEYNDDGSIKFEGNEMYPLDIRDCGMDPSAMHIKGAKWFQYRTWEHIEDLESQSDTGGKPLYDYLGTIKSYLKEQMGANSAQRRKDSYVRRVPQLRGLEDRVGEDMAFPVIEIVHELREDRWIDYFADLKLIIRDIPNPYKHGKIPVAQLRYYPLQDDPLGESEVEPVIPIWKAIQATVCGYMDEVILKMRPPLKIIQNAVTIETIVYGPEAQWLVTRPDAITEMQSNGEAIRYFETTYSALISAFNVAMGDMSQGTSSVTPFEGDKTATEVKASLKQQNVRDQKNQNDLAEFIKDIMLMWLSNNKQFLFTNPEKQEYILRVIGNENFEYFKRAGLDGMTLEPEVARMIGDIVEQKPEMTDVELGELIETGKTPKHPVYENPEEKEPSKIKYKPKMRMSDMGDSAELSITPDDLEGTYDYIADVKSMSAGATQELMESRMKAMDLLLNNANVIQLLAQEGYKTNVKELITDTFEDQGLRDADRYFEKIETQALPPTAGGPQPNMPQPGLPALPQANPAGGLPEQMAGSVPAGLGGQASLPNAGAVPPGI
jgi:hypothetical protein